MNEEASYIKKAIEDEQAIQILKDALREEPSEVAFFFVVIQICKVDSWFLLLDVFFVSLCSLPSPFVIN